MYALLPAVIFFAWFAAVYMLHAKKAFGGQVKMLQPVNQVVCSNNNFSSN
jgi:hypothetical protein